MRFSRIALGATVACGVSACEPSPQGAERGASAPAVVTAASVSTAPSEPSTVAPSSASALPNGPAEPWFADKEGVREECVPPLAGEPKPPLPPPFSRCDPRVEAWHSPPTGHELHFHYREFSRATTLRHRAKGEAVCCYLVWAFPR